jgi:hypothetical protein
MVTALHHIMCTMLLSEECGFVCLKYAHAGATKAISHGNRSTALLGGLSLKLTMNRQD